MKNKYENYMHSELTGKIIKCAFEVYNELSYGLPERIYRRAFEKSLAINNLSYKREVYELITFKNQIIGKYYLDFLIENSVAVEMKVRNEIYQKDVIQLLSYLKAEKLTVGLITAFTKNGVKIKRIANTPDSVNQRD